MVGMVNFDVFNDPFDPGDLVLVDAGGLVPGSNWSFLPAGQPLLQSLLGVPSSLAHVDDGVPLPQWDLPGGEKGEAAKSNRIHVKIKI